MTKLKLALLAAAACVGLTGCMSSGWTRLIPENKSSDIYVRSIYGTVEVHTRTDGSNGTNVGPVIIDGGNITPGTILQLRAR